MRKGIHRRLRAVRDLVADALPSRSEDGTGQQPSVPVLVYHRIEDVPGEITPATFREQVQALRADGWQTVTMTTLMDGLARAELPDRSVAITVDDGLQDVIRTIVPTLHAVGYVATVYAIPGWVGEGKHMTWAELVEVQAGGMEVGNHTMTHLALAKLPTDQVEWQIREADRVFRSEMPIPPATFAFPFGSSDDRALRVVRDVGYGLARVTRSGCAGVGVDPLQVPVVMSVKRHDSTAAVLRAVRRCA